MKRDEKLLVTWSKLAKIYVCRCRNDARFAGIYGYGASPGEAIYAWGSKCGTSKPEEKEHD